MLPRIAVVVALVAGIVLPAAAPTGAQEDAATRVLVLWLDGTTLADWSGDDLPAFRALLDEGAIGLLTAPSDVEGDDPADAALAGAEMLGAGRIVPNAPTEDQRRTPVALTLASLGITTSLLSGAPEPMPRTAERAFGPIGVLGGGRYARQDRAFPGGSRSDPDAMIRALDGDAAQARLVIAHVPDALLVEAALGSDQTAREQWAALTMRRADRILAALRARATERDLVLVVSPTPPRARRTEEPPLTAIGVARGGVAPGLLRSATTRRDGLVSLSDVAPTILAGLGVPPGDVERLVLPRFIDPPLPFDGNPVEAVARANALEAARALEGDLLDAAEAHRTSARAFLLAAILIVLLGVMTVVAGRGRAPRVGLIPRGWRDGVGTAGLAVVALPGASLLAGAFGARLWLTIVIAVVGALLARATVGRERGGATLVVVSMFLVLGDALASGPLSARAALPIPMAFGRRLLPMDPVAVGMVLAALPAAGALLDRARADDRWAPLLVGVGGLAVFLAGSEGAGGDGGAAAALLPALLLLVAAAWGLRRDVFVITAIVAVTIAGLGLLALTYGPAIWVDETPLIPQRGITTGLGARWDAFVDGLPTVWLLGLVVTGGLMLALRARRPMLTDRGWWGRAHLRAGAFAASIGSAIAVVTVRAGIATATTAVAMTSILLLVPLLAPDD